MNQRPSGDAAPSSNPTGAGFLGNFFFGLLGGSTHPMVHPEALQLINAIRAQQRTCASGLTVPAVQPLTWDPVLARLASEHVVLEAYKGRLTQDGYDGSTVLSRLHAAGVTFEQYVELDGRGHPTVQAQLEAWARGTSTDSATCTQIMAGYFTRFGMATAYGRARKPYYCALLVG